MLRFLHGGPIHAIIDLDLKAPEYRSAVTTQTDFNALNPGYVSADGQEFRRINRRAGSPVNPQKDKEILK